MAAVLVNGERLTKKVSVGCKIPLKTGLTQTFVGKIVAEAGVNVIEFEELETEPIHPVPTFQL